MQAPNYPDAGRSWNIVDKYKVSIFYTAPTLVRSLMRDGDEVRYLYAYSIPPWKIICDGEQKVLHMEKL
jgi:acyl-coenzyme A synthetase/AMP-(fatty) acid ligase